MSQDVSAGLEADDVANWPTLKEFLPLVNLIEAWPGNSFASFVRACVRTRRVFE